MAKKFNLREFQTNLSRQLQAATTRETAFSRLGFQVGKGNWLVALDQAEEVIPVVARNDEMSARAEDRFIPLAHAVAAHALRGVQRVVRTRPQ